MWKRKSGDWTRGVQAMWRLSCDKARAVEIKMWRSESKEKEDERRKDVSKSGMKILLRIGGSQIREEKSFEVQWNHLIAEGWREDVKI